MKQELRRALAALKKQYNRLARAEELSGDPALLGDHYRMLTDLLKAALRFLKAHGTEEYNALWEQCETYYLRAAAVREASIVSFFSAAGPDLCAGASLGILLPARIAVIAASQYGQAVPPPPSETPFSHAIKSLFVLREIDFEAILAAVCRAEQLLERDSAYAQCDPETKARYRRAVVYTARKTRRSQEEVILEAFSAGKHIGFSLPVVGKRTGGAVFLLAEALCPAALAVFAAVYICKNADGFFRSVPGGILLGLLLYLALFGAARPVFDWLLSKLRRPYRLPSLDPERETVSLPPVLITVSSLLPAAAAAGPTAKHLESLFASHSGSPACVVLLADLKNAEVPTLASDAAQVAAMEREILRLNEKHGGGFLLAVRGRVFSPSENLYSGYERKRGALETLVRLCRTGENGFETLSGDTSLLQQAKYMLALDADTELPFEELRRLMCVAWHPLNRAVLNAEKTAVVSGYGCFAPRAEVSVASAGATFFSRVMTWGGVSAYSSRVSGRYMDLFGTSVFSGKGLIDLEVYDTLCAGAFPAGRILSHDILEGSVLRTAFVSTCVVTESFPASPASFYKRQDRWLRGDVQNLRFVFRPRLTGMRGARLGLLSRIQLLDNVLRGTLPGSSLILLMLSLFFPFRPALLLFLVALTARAAPGLISALHILIGEGVFGFSRIYFSSGFSAGVRALLRTVFSVAFWPYEAAVCTDALLRGFWRGFFSHKRTLEWTTAAEAERGGGRRIFYPVLSPVLAALFLTLGHPFHLMPAAVFLIFAPFAVSDGGKRSAVRRGNLTALQYDTLSEYAAAMWRYFADYAGPEDHYLPPDNVQETPVRRVAHRTSPTNIGLYLLCVLAAADLSLISPGDLSFRLRESLKTVFSLPHRNGLLYNWYDTRTLTPLDPAFLSSVDAGNYLVCLTALKEGLKEYLPLDLGFGELIGWIEAELAGAQIESLYVPRRKLFSIGRNLSDGTLSDSYYDSYMSEARLTSFYACAKRKVPGSHWAALDRSFLRRGRHTAAASYGGTAFEYLMPALFLPLYENTYAAEGLKGCVYEQRRRVRGTARPYGVSESGYYAFDESLNYCYRAHGLRALALKRDPEDADVYAPYAAFLCFPVGFRDALKNLRHFASLGAYGACGFYEAVDFSSRALGEDYMIVRSYMAHHVGMSMLSAVNVMREDLFVKRFMRDPDMESAMSLLLEKIPSDAPVHSVPRRTEPKKRPPRPRTAANSGQFTESAAFSNGELTLLCEKTGKNRVLYGGRSLFRASPRAHGVTAAVQAGGNTTLLFSVQSRILSTGLYDKNRCGALMCEGAMALLRSCAALALPVKLRNPGKTAEKASLLYYFEPLFEPLFFASEHPAFSDLNLRVSYEAQSSALLLQRLERGKPTVFLAVGFSDSSPFAFTCDRESLPGNDSATLFAGFPPVLDQNTAFAFPGVGIRTEVLLPRDGKKEKVLLFCPAPERGAALAALARLRKGSLPDLRAAARISIPSEAAAYAERLFGSALFGAVDPDLAAAAAENTAPFSALWQKGISGDLPVLRVHTDGLPKDFIRAFLRLYRALSFCGVRTDLVFLTEKAAGYEDAAGGALKEQIKAEGLEDRLHKNAGIRILTAESCSKTFLSALSAVPGLRFPFDAPGLLPPAGLPPVSPAKPLFGGENTFVPGGYFIGSRPPRPWSHTLSNPVFGTLMTHESLGYTWAMNARLNQLTPWQNDPAVPFSGERLLLSAGGALYDCIRGASVYFLDDSAVYGAKCGDAEVRTTVQIDRRAMKKRISVSVAGVPGEAVLIFRICPLLAESGRRAGFLRGRVHEGRLIFRNPANTEYPGVMGAAADGTAAAELFPGAGELRVLIQNAAEIRFFLAFAAKEAALEALLRLPFSPPSPVRRALSLPDPEQRQFTNALLLHEVYDTRILARTGLYQCSGAYGFRDQLQDTMNLCAVYPARTKLQLLRCAAAQFREGDVLHWFHIVTTPSPHAKGVRTRCADDLLWLPLAAAEYLRRTGDTEIFSKEIAYLSGEPLAPEESERYADYFPGQEKRSFYDHCVRAVSRALVFGAHGLPLMRAGDWNDSMNEVGVQGKGESVWLGMFLILVCERFSAVSQAIGDREMAAALLQIAASQRGTIRKTAYNGLYFVRGFYDSGAILGGRESDACAIDLLPQAFAVFARVGTAAERRQALKTAFDSLYDERSRVLRLFYPPFTAQTARAGYVNDYPPGMRENAGQYTHAAVWFRMALAREGLTEEAEKLRICLFPHLRYGAGLGEIFRNEPYAMTADISMTPGLEGRGGWSLYTGAAGWLWRMLSEEDSAV